MDHFEPIGGETGVGAVEDLKCFIRQVEDDCTWGEEIAASYAVTSAPPSEMPLQKKPEDDAATARKRRRTAAWNELVERTVRARVYAGADSSSMADIPDGVDTSEVETVLYDPNSFDGDTGGASGALLLKYAPTGQGDGSGGASASNPQPQGPGKPTPKGKARGRGIPAGGEKV